MKRIVITGGCGFLCYELVRELSAVPNIKLAVVTSRTEEVAERFQKFEVEVYCNEDLLNGKVLKAHSDCLIHTAFCRKDDGKKLVESLHFAEKVFRMAAESKADVINISSQSVYGMTRSGELPTEVSPVCPEYSYALAKAASEIILETVIGNYAEEVQYTNIRMASLIGPGYFIPDNITYKFMMNALKGNGISIVGGKQRFSFLDVRDAAQALCRMITAGQHKWKKVYNLGHTKQTDIVYMAETVNNCVALLGLDKVPIQIKEEDIFINAGMNSNRFYGEFCWKPKYSLEDTVQDCLSLLCGKTGEQKRISG